MLGDILFGMAGILNEITGNPVGIIAGAIDDATRKTSHYPVRTTSAPMRTQKDYIQDRIIKNRRKLQKEWQSVTPSPTLMGLYSKWIEEDMERINDI